MTSNSEDHYCPQCGEQMPIVPMPRRLLGRFSRSRQQINVVCPRCGARTGFGGKTAVMMLGRHPTWRDPVAWLRFRWRMSRTMARAARLSPETRGRRYMRPDMRLDLAALVADMPFPVYGLIGHPSGLRVQSPGHGSGGGFKGSRPTRSIHFGYVFGDRRSPSKAMYVEQDNGLDQDETRVDMAEGSAIRSLLGNYGPKTDMSGADPRRFIEEMQRRREIENRDWNWERIRNAPRRMVTLEIGGSPVDAEIASFETPLPVNIARLPLQGSVLIASSLGLSPKEFSEALSTLTELRENSDALAEIVRDFEEAHREFQEYNERLHS